jgi:hypothetical protein
VPQLCLIETWGSNCREHGLGPHSRSRRGKQPSVTLLNPRLTCENVVISTSGVDLMGRLSNPPETLENLSEQGCHGSAPASRKTLKSPKRSSSSPGRRDSNNKGQLSNPASMALCGDDDAANPPTAGPSARPPGPPVQRRLTLSQLQAIAARYQSGRSLHDLAREFRVHHRTVADHLERLGIARRVSLPKLSAAEVNQAATRYRAGESLAIVGKALNVHASTVGRALKRAGIKVRPRPGTEWC